MNSFSIRAGRASGAALRLAARLGSLAILLFFAWMVVGHLVGDAGAATRPLVLADYLGMALLAAATLGLAVAFRHERAGAALTLVAFAALALLNPRIILSPILFLPLIALLFHASAHRDRPSSN
jgi:hypothetical protein